MTERNRTPSFNDQIAETRARMQLLESEREAQFASDRATMEKNNETIRCLKEEIKNFSKDLADAKKSDENIVEAAFCNRGPEKLAYRNKSVQEVFTTIQEKKVAEVQQWDAQKDANNSYQSRMEELEMEYERLEQLAARQAQNKAEQDDMKRSLEIEVEHSLAKDREAEKTMANYVKMKRNIQEGRLTLEGEIDFLKKELRTQKEELQRLRLIEINTTAAREDSKAEFQQLQKLINREHQERYQTLESHRRDNQTACSSLKWSDDTLDSAAMMAEEEEEKDLSYFQKAFKSLREVTGATNIQEVVDQFILQKEKTEKLQTEKDENEAAVQQLKEQQMLQSEKIYSIKHSGEAELSSDGQTQEELKQKLLAEQKFPPGKDSWLFGRMSAARVGVEHLGHKLKVSVGEDVDPDSEQFVVQLMDQVKLRIQEMFTELQGIDVAAVLKEAEEEWFLKKMEEGLPPNDIRIKLSDDGGQKSEDEEDDNSEDDD